MATEVKTEIRRDTELHLFEVWLNGRLMAQRILTQKTAEDIKLALLKERE